MGDQTSSWDDHDGAKSALIGMMNAGLSGFGFSHSDIGGSYSVNATSKNGPLVWRTPQLMKRWAEMSAFTDAIFRSHPGSRYMSAPGEPNPKDLQVWYSDDLMASFKRTALIHKTLWPYRMKLMQEHHAIGAPVVRHMFLHFFDDPECWNLPLQYMLGSDMLVAPTFGENVTTTLVYLPSTRTWTHVWSGSMFSSGWHNVSTPIGFPAVFVTTPMSSVIQAIVDELRQI
jgi:alpha-glucosidase (family GH31 glycosyl hydrolase)